MLGDVEERRWLRTIGPGPAVGVCFSPDGRVLASCGRSLLDFHGRNMRWDLRTFDDDKQIHVWNSHTGESLRTLDKDATALAFVADSEKLVSSGGEEGSLDLWDLSNGKKFELQSRGCAVSRLSVSPGGRYIAAGLGNDVVLWDAATGRIAVRWKGHQAPVMNVMFTPDAKYLISASVDRTALVWRCP